MSVLRGKSSLLLLLMLMLGWLEHGHGAARPFTRRFTADIAGDIVQIGNTNMTAPAGTAGDAARNGTGTALNNNDHSMVFVDIDTDSTTFNSSSATLALPAGARVLFAGLYWGSDTATGTGVTAAPNAAIRTQVIFATPTSGYATRTSTIDDSTSGYSCFSDVTSLVSSAGSGAYTVANIQGSRTTNRFSGWALVVAYTQPGAPPRNLSIFDGHQLVNSGTTSVNIAISGFRTPANGAVRTHIGAVVMEGDLGLTGDTMTLNGVNIPSPADPQNPSTNVFNSTITRLGTRLSAKTPDYINQLGWDVDDFNANGVLANNATSATINVTTGGETYMPIMVSFATDLYAPDHRAQKRGGSERRQDQSRRHPRVYDRDAEQRRRFRQLAGDDGSDSGEHHLRAGQSAGECGRGSGCQNRRGRWRSGRIRCGAKPGDRPAGHRGEWDTGRDSRDRGIDCRKISGPRERRHTQRCADR